MGSNQVVLSSDRRYNASEPAPKLSKFNRQALMQMSDKELYDAERDLKSLIYHARKNGENTRVHEIDLCYVQDEIYNRKKSKSSRN